MTRSPALVTVLWRRLRKRALRIERHLVRRLTRTSNPQPTGCTLATHHLRFWLAPPCILRILDASPGLLQPQHRRTRPSPAKSSTSSTQRSGAGLTPCPSPTPWCVGGRAACAGRMVARVLACGGWRWLSYEPKCILVCTATPTRAALH